MVAGSSKRRMFAGVLVMAFFTLFLLSYFQHSNPYLKSTAFRIFQDSQHCPSQASQASEVVSPSHRCVDPKAVLYRRVEDIFCQKIPDFEKELKNPCFYEYGKDFVPTLKCLPYFYIIGMDKCGTTDLHSRMMSHPHIRGNRGSLDKETQFWAWKRYGVFNYENLDHNLNLEEYLNKFNKTSVEIQNKTSVEIITGDATPMDLWDFRFWRRIPQNFGKSTPEVLTPHMVKYIHKGRTPKLLIQLREPVERLYSDFFFLGHGNSPQSFHNAVVRALHMMKTCIAKHGTRHCFYDRDLYQKLPTRIHLGCYSVFIEEWLNVFPRSAFHITRTEDFHTNTTETLTSVFKFLEIAPLDSAELNKLVKKDRKHVTKNKKGTMKPETYRLLKEFYDPCIQKTAALLNDSRYLWQDVYSRLKH